MSIVLELRNKKDHAGIPLVHATSEHVVLADVFGIIKNFPSDFLLNAWLGEVTRGAIPPAHMWKLSFWESQSQPEGVHEGSTEVDLVIESDTSLIFVEVKMDAPPSSRTSHDKDRNQLTRNLDVGYHRTSKGEGTKAFALVYITPDLKQPEEVQRVQEECDRDRLLMNPGIDPKQIRRCLYWTPWSSIGHSLAQSYTNNKANHGLQNFALDVLSYLAHKRLWENSLPDEELFYGDKLYRSLQKSDSQFRPYASNRPLKDQTWRKDLSWDRPSLIHLLSELNLKQKAFVKVLAEAGGRSFQKEIMNRLPFLNGNARSLLGIKRAISTICKQKFQKAPLVDQGSNGSGDWRMHEINPALGSLKQFVIEEAMKFEIPPDLLG